MRKVLLTSLIVAIVIGIGIVFAAPDEKGNGLPKGKSYNFNVIAVPNAKQNWDIDSGGEGKRIFILRTDTTQFFVHGEPGVFDIVDHDGTDGKVGTGGNPTAEGYIPGIILPYDTTNHVWDCLVFVRLLGPPDSHFQWARYYFDGSDWALIDSFRLDRSTKFIERTDQILDDRYQDIMWEWTDKHTLRNCQFRIFVID